MQRILRKFKNKRRNKFDISSLYSWKSKKNKNLGIKLLLNITLAFNQSQLKIINLYRLYRGMKIIEKEWKNKLKVWKENFKKQTII